ncbi:MAG: GNAT family N-acetyltransferase [Candidatus Gastranaerophilales bacterium]|nr:GNAT family N-acetyltransferase [Candidatus Gastranaerophilales bacterium]
MNISFGKKIPIMQTQIQNLQTGAFEPATVYELDCTDETDILETIKPQNSWTYARDINRNMCDKYIQQQIGEDSNLSFYILQNQKGETLGMAQTEEQIKNAHNLSLFDTKKNKQYKYVGQTLLASVSKDIMSKAGVRLSVFDPHPSAIAFYDKICGFQNFGNIFLSADKKQMNKFIQQTEQRTNAQLVNLKG